MRTYDFTPLWRSTIGFDRLFDLVETAQRAGEDNYPPYNIERLGEDRYQISLAVAGFSADEIDVTAEQNTVTIEGRKADTGQREYLYQGISARPFKRQFSLADHVQVKTRVVRGRPAAHRTVPGSPGGDEAASHRDQRRGAGQRSADRGEGGLSPSRLAKGPSSPPEHVGRERFPSLGRTDQ